MGVPTSDGMIYAKFPCPYCGHENGQYSSVTQYRRPTVILCDIENGPGCDRYFVARIKHWTPEIVTLPIEQDDAL